MGAKIQRKYMAHYLNTNFGLNNTDEYVLLGIGLEESSIEMGANVNKTADIVGNTDTFIDTYEKSQSIEPYYARKEDMYYNIMKQTQKQEKFVFSRLKWQKGAVSIITIYE